MIDEGELELLGSIGDRRKIIRSLRDNPERGKPLTGALVGCRRIRVGDNRLVYRVTGDLIEVIAIGRRRADEVYQTASGRA